MHLRLIATGCAAAFSVAAVGTVLRRRGATTVRPWNLLSVCESAVSLDAFCTALRYIARDY